jgi:hypothetical protein
MNAWQFMSESPWLTFFLLWLVVHHIALVLNRIIRHFNIRKAGWPTAPLMDADGDIIHPKDEDDD